MTVQPEKIPLRTKLLVWLSVLATVGVLFVVGVAAVVWLLVSQDPM